MYIVPSGLSIFLVITQASLRSTWAVTLRPYRPEKVQGSKLNIS